MYETDQDQVEALKRWWDQWGNYIIGGVLLFLAAYFGLNYYQSSVEQKNQAASDMYEEILQQDSVDTLEPLISQLAAEHKDSGYVTLAQLRLAKVQVEAEDLTGARDSLIKAAKSAATDELKLTAEYRLARVHLALAEYDAAMALVDRTPKGFTTLFTELKGDILRAQGDTAGAYAAYKAAQEATVTEQVQAPMLQLKLDAIKPASE